MMADVADEEIVHHVVSTTGLNDADAQRVVDDVIAYYHEPVAEFVRRRHQQLQTYGMRNTEAFDHIAAEVSQRVVAAAPLTTRQIRRIIYS